MKLLVIGGGWAGIAAAMEGARKGHDVTLVEERPYIGGRARSFADRTTGDVIDNGQHVMMGCYHELLRICRDLGTEHHLERQQALRVAFVDPRRGRHVLDAGMLPGRLGMALGLLRLGSMPIMARVAIVRQATRILVSPDSAKGLTCSELFARSRQPREAIERFWEPLILATLNAPVETASAEMLCAVLRLAFFGSTTDATLLIPTAGLSDLVEPFPAWLDQRGGRVLLSTGVERINLLQGRAVSVELSDTTTLQADAIVCATPLRAMDRLMRASGIDMPPMPEVQMSPIVSLYLWYDRQWMDTDFAAALSTTVQWVFNKERIAKGLVALTVSSASDIVGMPTEEVVRLCDDELRRLFPKSMSGASVRHGVVIKEKHATPLISPTIQAMRPPSDLFRPQVRGLFIAGDWTQTGLPATLEGAARSGVAAIAAAQNVAQA
ncbi:MAG: FAD-dependent oxidoreductase [Candidatus Kapabacteria bacterium]|nr:FAD-dependent oxidoreductase [Candidatus Kapabacteria bacterium]